MSSGNKKFRVAFIHPDLGIGVKYPFFLRTLSLTIVTSGGAERLVVDAALGLQALGHSVDIYTSHHDPNHSFDETNNGVCEISGFPIAQSHNHKASQALSAFITSDLHFLVR